MSRTSFDRQRTQVTLLYDTGEREDDALARLQWVIPTVVLGAAAILFFSVTQWASAWMPAAAYAVLVWLPVCAVVWWKSRGASPGNLVRVMAVLALLGAPLLTWFSGDYRAAVLWAADEIIPVEVARLAIDDPSDAVATLSCQRLLISGDPGRVERVRPMVEERPDVAVECLEEAADHDRGAAVRLAHHLRQSWYEEWMYGESVDEYRACAQASTYVRLGKLYEASSAPHLLMCTLDAEPERLSRCCARALSEGVEDEEILRVQPEQVRLRGLDESLFLALVDAVDLPAQELMSQQPVGGGLEWTPADLFHWTTHLGCDLMAYHRDSEGVALQLSRTIETQCGLDVGDPLFSFAAVRFVDRTCDKAVDVGKTERIDIEEWCSVAREANEETAFDAARFSVYRAHRAFVLDEVASIIEFGLLIHQWLEEYERRIAYAGPDEVPVGPDGVRRGPSPRIESSPEVRQRMEAMRSDDRQRRQRIRAGVDDGDGELSELEVERRVDEAARQELFDSVQSLGEVDE